ncbi:MAG: hypothetical protein NZ928_05060 [Endomicrobia bacterium]|nr:hypothetical protein [Endomicrobiia bacterium]
MKQEVNQNYKNLIKYCYEILKHSRRGQHLFLNIYNEAKYFVDMSEVRKREILLFGEDEEIRIYKSVKYDNKESYRSTSDKKEQDSLFDLFNQSKNINNNISQTNDDSKPLTQFQHSSPLKEEIVFEKIRRIYDNYTNNPYELEIIYCYLFISGKKSDGSIIFAPLFIIPA